MLILAVATNALVQEHQELKKQVTVPWGIRGSQQLRNPKGGAGIKFEVGVGKPKITHVAAGEMGRMWKLRT